MKDFKVVAPGGVPTPGYTLCFLTSYGLWEEGAQLVWASDKLKPEVDG